MGASRPSKEKATAMLTRQWSSNEMEEIVSALRRGMDFGLVVGKLSYLCIRT